jgi:nucleotide-binding universal stress UspA family protein
MIAMRRILCPVDFSDHSKRALDHARAIAAWYDSTVTVLHVCPVTPVAAYVSGSGMPAYLTQTAEERDAIMQSLRRFAGGETSAGVQMEFEVTEGGTVATILARATALPADLLVLGTHGRSGFERWVLGSITEKVLRMARCPVLTVPKDSGDAVPVVFRRVVCAIDFSECSLHALDYATSLAREADAQLTVVHVIELPPDLPREVHETVLAGPRNVREYVALAEEEGRARLTDAVADHVRPSVTVDTVLADGKPYREILRVAAEHGADLLVVGVHGRGAFDRMLFGSTTQHLVRQASCPVLTLRTD